MEEPSITIKVDDDYIVKISHYNTVPFRKAIIKKGKNSGETAWLRLGYYTSLGCALRVIARDKMRMTGDDLTLKEYIDKYEELEKRLSSIKWKDCMDDRL